MNDIPTLIQKLDNFDARIKRYQKGAAITIDYGGRSSTLGETVDNVDNLSTVDWLDLATLGLDIMAIFPTGPVAAGSGIAGGITGLTADIKRDGLNWQNGLTG
jgi:hypothetical protein